VPIASSVALVIALATASPRPAVTEPRDDGIGLLATGGLMAIVGATLSALPLVHGVSCGTDTCVEPASLARATSMIAPALYGVATPFLAVGMYRARMARIHRELARDPRRTVRPPRRFALAAGWLTMAAGAAMLGGAVAMVDEPYGDVALWIGGPTLVCGALVVGSATAQRHAAARAPTIAPVFSPHMAGVTLAHRF
jgi:hypothetical protein